MESIERLGYELRVFIRVPDLGKSGIFFPEFALRIFKVTARIVSGIGINMDQENLPEEGRVPSQALLNLLFPDQQRRTEASDMRAVSPAAPVLKVVAEEQDLGTPLAEEVYILTLASPTGA